MTDEMRELLNNSYKGTDIIKYIEKLEKENSKLKLSYNNEYVLRKNLELKLDSLEKGVSTMINILAKESYDENTVKGGNK